MTQVLKPAGREYKAAAGFEVNDCISSKADLRNTRRALMTCLMTGRLPDYPGLENDDRIWGSCSVRMSIHSKIMADARRQCPMTLLSRQSFNTTPGVR